MTEDTEYKPSIFEKMIVPFKSYQEAKIRLQMLERMNPLPPDFQLRKTKFKAQMIAAENEMRELINP